VLALAVLVFYERSIPAHAAPKGVWAGLVYELDHLARRSAPWLAGILAVGAVSLSILQLFQWADTGSTHLAFQHGQTAVSAFWGLLGLTVLYLGLKRDSAHV